jgi:hypothetical protein
MCFFAQNNLHFMYAVAKDILLKMFSNDLAKNKPNIRVDEDDRLLVESTVFPDEE